MGDLSFARNKLGLTRTETINGVEYLVAPTVAFMAGVFNEELVTSEELGAFFEAWNGSPFVIGHPQDSEGRFISANFPDTLADVEVGRLFNVAFDGDKLRGEVWIDVEKAATVDRGAEVVERLEQGKPLEVSSAYLRELEGREGELNGQAYSGVVRAIRPDHLAALLDDIGACSWSDGCGVPRVNCLQCNRHNDGAMVAFMLPRSLAKALAVDGGEDVESLHCTLAFLGKAKDINAKALLDFMRKFAAEEGPVSGVINGFGKFANADDDGKSAFYANFDAPALPEFRQRLVEGLVDAGANVVINHGFTPHITLAYLSPNDDFPVTELDIDAVTFDAISAVIASERTDFKLEGEPMLIGINILSTARRPTFDGTEEISWADVSKTFGAFRDGFYRHTEAERPDDPPTQVQDAPQAMRDWIAARTLLGDPDADNERDLAFFPVVNPGTNRLNAGGVRGVLGGRGAQADIPEAAKESAQAMARGLLEEFFQTEASVFQKLKAMLRDALGELTGGELLSDPDSIESEGAVPDGPAEGSTVLVTENQQEDTMDREEIVAFLIQDGRLGVEESDLAEASDELLAKLVQHLADMDAAQQQDDDDHPEPEDNQAVNVTNCTEAALPAEVAAFMQQIQERGGVEGLFASIDTLRQAETDRKAKLVSALVANKACVLSQEQLERLDEDTLLSLQRSFIPADFSGQGGAPVVNRDDMTPYEMPRVLVARTASD